MRGGANDRGHAWGARDYENAISLMGGCEGNDHSHLIGVVKEKAIKGGQVVKRLEKIGLAEGHFGVRGVNVYFYPRLPTQ